jgi:hypothetical protein
MRRPYLLALACLLPVLLVADYAYWRVVTGHLQRGLSQWEATLRADGWQLGSGAVVAGGWPLSARLTIPNPTLRRQGAVLIDMAAPSVAVTIPLWRPTELRVPIASPLHLKADGLPDLILSAEHMALAAHLVPNGTPAVLEAKALRLEPAEGTWHVAVARVSLAVAMEPGRSADVALNAQTIALPATTKWPLGQTASRLTLQGALTDLPKTAGSARQWAKTWRDGGGSLRITQYGLVWGPLDLSGSAELRLDDTLQPAGTGHARVVGYAAALDRLASAGAITRPAATAATALLPLLGRSASEGGNSPPVIDVPLTLQSRTLSIIQMPLLRLPELDWPAAQ